MLADPDDEDALVVVINDIRHTEPAWSVVIEHLDSKNVSPRVPRRSRANPAEQVGGQRLPVGFFEVLEVGFRGGSYEELPAHAECRDR